MLAIQADEICHCRSTGGSQYGEKPIDDNCIFRNFGCWISNLGRCTIADNDFFPHWLLAGERGHRIDINISS